MKTFLDNSFIFKNVFISDPENIFILLFQRKLQLYIYIMQKYTFKSMINFKYYVYIYKAILVHSNFVMCLRSIYQSLNFSCIPHFACKKFLFWYSLVLVNHLKIQLEVKNELFRIYDPKNSEHHAISLIILFDKKYILIENII